MSRVALHPVQRGGRYAGLLLLAWLVVASLFPRQQGVVGAVPEIILFVNDTIVSPGSDEYYLSVYLTNVLQSVAGVELTISAGVSGLIKLPDSTRIDTAIDCIDPVDCDPADTTIDTLHTTPIDLTGSALEHWDFVQARALSPYMFRLAAVADFPGGPAPAPLPTGGPRLLCRLLLEREATPETLDTLQDRRVPWQIARGETGFSDPTGQTIGLQDSLLCLNPPVCDSTDTVYYYDSTINIYVDGAVTFGPNCIRGDANGSETVNSADIIIIINYVFKGGPEPACHGESADVNCSGTVNSTDIVYMVNYVYKSGAAPCGG